MQAQQTKQRRRTRKPAKQAQQNNTKQAEVTLTYQQDAAPSTNIATALFGLGLPLQVGGRESQSIWAILGLRFDVSSPHSGMKKMFHNRLTNRLILICANNHKQWKRHSIINRQQRCAIIDSTH